MRTLFLLGILALGFTPPVHSAGPGSVRMFVRHEVTDYTAWRKVYDDLAVTRGAMGVTAQAVYRFAENLNDITVTHDFDSLEQARAYAASPELKAAMRKAGVTGSPEIWFTRLADGRPVETEAVRMYIRHEVAGFDDWKRIYDEFAGTRRRMGVTSQAAHRSVDDPNDITVTHDFRSVEQARAFASSAELRSAMNSSGVIPTARIWFTIRAEK